MLEKKRFSGLTVLVAAVSIFTTTTINSSTISDTKTITSNVGSIKGSFQVTAFGQAHYSMPIEVPLGTAGMTPALSIVYDSTSSNTRNGLLGMGFSLEGLTAITRCPSNKTQNGLIHGVDFTDKDRFCLNGEQLVAVKGNYGADAAEYRTYTDSKIKVISYGRMGNGPASFKVWTKGGRIAEYGLTDDSRVKAQGKDAVVLWGLNRIQDTVGNYLDAHYIKNEDEGNFYPIEVNYTGNVKAKLNPYNSVKFIYEDREDKRTTYQAGSKSTMDKRLKTIQVYQSTSLIYEYNLGYEISKNTFRSRITAIQKCAGGSACLPATKFEWQTNEAGWEWAPQYVPPAAIINNQGDSNPHGIDNGVRFIDLTGDGLLGMVQHVYWNSSNTQKGAWINNGHGWEEVPQYIPPAVITNNKGDSNPRGTDNGVRFVDLTGDGLLGMVQHVYWNSSNIQKGAWVNNGHGWEEAPQYTPPAAIINNKGDSNLREIDNGVRFVDLTGDGLFGMVQHVYWNSSNIQKGAWTNNGHGWEKALQYTPPVAIINNRGNNLRGTDNGVRFAGLTGNGLWGMVQHIYINPSNVQKATWVNNGNGWENALQYVLPVEIINNRGDSSSRGIDNGVIFVDLTGSGLADMVQGVCWNSNRTQKGAWINTGNGWIEASQYTPPVEIINNHADSNPRGIDNGVRFIDFTGSGLLGVVQHTRWNSSNIQKGAWVNNGHGWESIAQYVPPTEIANNRADSKQHGIDNGVVFIDLTGSGLPDIIQNIHWNASNIQKGAWFNCAKKLPDYLISVTDGFGVKLSIDYEPLSGKKVDVYTKEHNAKYPNVDWQGPMYVVYQTSSNTAANDPNVFNFPTALNHVTTYHYTGAKFNHLGMGFLGFHKVTTTDKTTGINTTTTYSQDLNLHNKGVPIAIETRLADGVLTASSEDFWELKTFGDGRVNTSYYSPYVKQSIKKSFDLKGGLISTTTINNTVDDYGNPTKIVSYVEDDITGITASTTTENTYRNDPQQWFLGELTSAKVTKSVSGRAAQTRASSFSYDPNTSLLIQSIAEPSDPKLALTTKHERDVFGNIISSTISGFGIEPRTVGIKYDNYGRFVVQTTNPLNQSVSQVVDPRFGVVIESIDLNGLRTFNQYDNFGRNIGQVAIDGTKTDINYSRISAASLPVGELQKALQNVSYVVTSHTQNSATQKEYYDILGRKVASTTQNMDGKAIWQLTYYDDLGRISQKTLPFFEGATIYYDKIQYDILGRVVGSVLPDGSITQIIYDGLTTTSINQLKQRQIKQVNAIGEMVKAIDNLGSITTYQYDAYSNMTGMFDSVGHISKIEYDHLGRKIAINDPDKGRWSYQYDVLGNLLSQTDALGNTTTFKYDKLDRVISRTDHAVTSTWEYDTAVKGVGKLAKIGSVNLVGKGAQERLLLVNKALHDGLEAYTRSYSYDGLSRPFQVKTSIRGKDYISSYSYDHNSRVDVETYPNGLRVKNSYNEFGYLVKISDAQTGKVYWQLNAQDAVGHLISESHSNGLITNYTYDPKTSFLTDITTNLDQTLATQKDLLPALTAIPAVNNKNLCDGKECKLVTPLMQQEIFTYDAVGNIQTHQDNVNNVNETFKYDALNRLTQAGSIGRETQILNYDAVGNITYKSDVGAYKYGENGAGPHAVTSITGKKPSAFQYDKNGDQIGGEINGVKRTITYTSYSKPLAIVTAKATTSFYYNADRQKFARVDETKGKTATTYYLGNYEVVSIDNGKAIITQQKSYIGPNTIHVKTEDSSDSAKNRTDIHEMLHNNLGSVTDITDVNGNITQHFAYTSFGEQIQTKGDVLYHPVTYKGFTGHEGIEGANLIHMDGRIYDPVIGRFLSADPYIQEPGNSQSLNRYSYCINNPLAFTDPSGFGFWSSLGRSICKGFKAVVNSPIGRIVIGVAIAIIAYFCPPLGVSLYIWQAAALGAAVTVGIGLAVGVNWKQALFEGAVTFVLAYSLLSAYEVLASQAADKSLGTATKSGFGSGLGGVGGANEEPFNNQGEDFKDRSFHNSTTNASSSNAAVHQNAQPSLASDRTEINENYSNGAKSSAFEKISGFIKGNLQHAADNLASCLVVDNVARQQCVSYLSEGFAGVGRLAITKVGYIFPAVEEVVGKVITGYTRHGLNQAISRNAGKGVSPSAILDTVRNPTEVIRQAGGVAKYVGERATVILNKAGKIITTYGESRG